jgi:hypothetical protein
MRRYAAKKKSQWDLAPLQGLLHFRAICQLFHTF